MFFRIARYYLRIEWVKIAAVVFFFVLYSILMVNNTKTMPMTYEAFVSQYDRYNYIHSEKSVLDKLAESESIPREQLGNTFEEAYPVFNERHFSRFLGNTGNIFYFFTPILTGGMAALFICIVFQRRRLVPLMASGCSRGTVYLFLMLLYFCFILLIWLVAVPLCLSCYRLPLTGEQLVCLQLIESTLLIALLFGGAVAFFFAFLLRRPIPVFLASAISLFLLQRLSGLVPVPVKLLISLMEWESNTSTQLLIAQSCVTIVVLIAAIVGGWLCFQRQEQT